MITGLHLASLCRGTNGTGSRLFPLREWILQTLTSMSSRLNLFWGVVAWLVPRETAAVSAQVLCTPCTFNHAPVYSVTSFSNNFNTKLANMVIKPRSGFEPATNVFTS